MGIYKKMKKFRQNFDQNFNNFKYIQNNNDLICSGDNWEFKWYNNGINYTNDKEYFPDIKCNIDNGANIDNITEIRVDDSAVTFASSI